MTSEECDNVLRPLVSREICVRVYFKTSRTIDFPARDLDNAKDIAARCATEYVWVVNDDGSEEYFPPSEIHKVKIVPSARVPHYDRVATAAELAEMPPHLREGLDANPNCIDNVTYAPYKIFQRVRYDI